MPHPLNFSHPSCTKPVPKHTNQQQQIRRRAPRLPKQRAVPNPDNTVGLGFPKGHPTVRSRLRTANTSFPSIEPITTTATFANHNTCLLHTTPKPQQHAPPPRRLQHQTKESSNHHRRNSTAGKRPQQGSQKHTQRISAVSETTATIAMTTPTTATSTSTGATIPRQSRRTRAETKAAVSVVFDKMAALVSRCCFATKLLGFRVSDLKCFSTVCGESSLACLRLPWGVWSFGLTVWSLGCRS